MDGDAGATTADATAGRRHVVVFGFQGVGRRIVRQLTSAGLRVVVVDAAANAAQQEDIQRWGATYLTGYGDSQDTLHAVHVTSALAVLCVTDDDLRNIRLAMLARDAAPDVRVVVRMANSSVGTAMRSVAQPGAVLDVAELASTSFVEVATARSTHPLTLGDETFLVATYPAPDSGTIRSMWGELAPVARQAADGSGLVACPHGDDVVAAGDLITLIGTVAEFGSGGSAPSTDHARALGPTLRRRVREALASMSDAVDRPFRVAFAILVGLAVVSVVVLTNAYQERDGTHMSVLDAIYFTAETIATVGFGDFYFRDQPTWLRMWAILLIIVGAALVAIATALLTNALVTRRLEQSLGRQRLTGMKGHIVVVGLGRVGAKVAMELHEAGYEVAVIDGGEGQRFVPQMRELRVPVLIGDATLAETLAAAGVERASGVAVLTSDDLLNIETGLAVRGTVGERPVPIALRVFSRNLARLIGSELDAGIPRSIAELASPWFVGAALGIDILGTFYVGRRLFIAVRLVIQPGSGLDGAAVRDLGARARVVAVERSGGGGALQHPPGADAIVGGGDAIYVIGQYDDLLALFQRA